MKSMKKMIFLIMVFSLGVTVVAQNNLDRIASPDDSRFVKKVLNASVYISGKEVSMEDLTWNPHPSFKGVYLKHLITGKDTNDQLSLHIVKIEPNCILDTHVHNGKIEIHEVVGGSGVFYLEDKEMFYSAGIVSVIPANTSHKIKAGENGLYLFASFTPALQ